MDDDIDRYPLISRGEGKPPPDAAAVAFGRVLPPSPDEFSSPDEFFDFLEEVDRIQVWGKKRKPPGPVPTVDREGTKQVGLRLPGADYARLAEFGKEFGVAPATMARILVVRAMRPD